MDAVFIEEFGWRILWDFSFFYIFLFCYCFYYGGGVNMAEFRCVFCFCCLFYVCYRNLITNAIMFGCKSVCIVCVEGCQLGRGVGLGFSGFLQEDGLFAVINLFWLLLRLGWMMWCKLQIQRRFQVLFLLNRNINILLKSLAYACTAVV